MNKPFGRTSIGLTFSSWNTELPAVVFSLTLVILAQVTFHQDRALASRVLTFMAQFQKVSTCMVMAVLIKATLGGQDFLPFPCLSIFPYP